MPKLIYVGMEQAINSAHGLMEAPLLTLEVFIGTENMVYCMNILVPLYVNIIINRCIQDLYLNCFHR